MTLPFFLMDPDVQARAREAQAREREAERLHFENVLVPDVRAWHPTIEKPRRDICYSAAAFTDSLTWVFEPEECPAVLPEARILDTDRVRDTGIRAVGGKYPISWIYRNVLLPRGHGIQAYPGRNAPTAYFDDDVAIPVLYRYRPWMTWGSASFEVWMSITPMEFFTLRPGVRFATRKVMVAGLGLGLILRQIAQKRTVQHIVLVEESEALLDWYGYELISDIEDATGTYIETVNADVYTYLAEAGTKGFTRLIFDIWEGWREARHDKSFQKIYAADKRKIWFWGARMLVDASA